MAGKVVKQLAGGGSGQSFMDRVTAAKHSISGSGIAKSVCKATTEEMIAPKKKHLEYLTQCTHEPNVSIPHLANLLIERSQQGNWVVVFKALLTIHHVMNYGNERFSQYLASNNCQLSLPSFTDKSGTQAYDMSSFIRHYSKYLNDKAVAYREMAFDFCKIKRGKDDGVLRTMALNKLMKALPLLQALLDALLSFDATSGELSNPVILMTYMLLYKDLIRLFAAYNEGMINLIERFFTMNKKQCRDALDLYKTFLQRMDRVNAFLKVAESTGCCEKDSSGLQPVPPTVLDALEQHLASLEGRKYVPKGTLGAGGETPIQQNGSSSGATATISNPAPATTSQRPTAVPILTDTEKQRIIEEEQRRLDEFAANRSKAATMTSVSSSSSSSTAASGSGTTPVTAVAGPKKPSDDLILLGLDVNPRSGSSAAAPTPVFESTNPFNTSVWGGSSAPMPAQQMQLEFGASEINFEEAFGGRDVRQPISGTAGMVGTSGLAGILQPTLASSQNNTSKPPTGLVNNSSTSPVAAPMTPSQPQPAPPANNLDARLASLADSLTIRPGMGGQNGGRVPTEVRWTNHPPSSTTHSTSSPTSAQPTARTGLSPFGQPMLTAGPSVNWSTMQQPGAAAAFSTNQIPAYAQYSYGQPVTMCPWPTVFAGMSATTLGYHPAAMMYPQQPFPSSSNNNHQQPPSTSVNDPFGVL